MSDLERILKLASHGTADAQSQAPAGRELKDVPVVEEPTAEAVGEFAEPIYDLIDMHFEGDCQPVFDDLVRYLSGDQIEDFVADFRRNHDLNDDMDEAKQLNASEYKCEDCGDTMHKPTTDCSHDSHDETGSWWKDKDGNGVPDSLEEAPNEGNEFSGALAQAKKDGKKEFEVDGKKYKVEESEPMGEYTDKEFACINIDTGEYGYCDKDELHKYTHMVPAKEFTYFDDTSGMNFADFDDEMADQEGWTKIASNESAPMGEYTDKEFACINIDTGEYGYCDKDELHKYTHYVPAKEFTYFDDENEDMDFADFDDEMADQEGWTKIGNPDVGDPELARLRKLAGNMREETVNELNVPNDKEKVKAQAVEEISEAPTMDTTQLITLLKNAGLSEEKIKTKLDEWANTPAGAAEEEATSHGEPYENYAQSVNLSLKRYLDAEDMKVGLKEHKVEDIKEAYKKSKGEK